jgi:hypothetical protein
MPTIEHLKLVALEFEALTGTPLRTLSSRIFDDGKRLGAIVAGTSDLTTSRFDAAMAWFSANWPADAAWPAEVARPAAVEAAEGGR